MCGCGQHVSVSCAPMNGLGLRSKINGRKPELGTWKTGLCARSYAAHSAGQIGAGLGLVL